MNCKEYDAHIKQENEYTYAGTKEHFVIDSIETEYSEYPNLTNFSQSGIMYSINKDSTLGEKIGTCDMLKGRMNET